MKRGILNARGTHIHVYVCIAAKSRDEQIEFSHVAFWTGRNFDLNEFQAVSDPMNARATYRRDKRCFTNDRAKSQLTNLQSHFLSRFDRWRCEIFFVKKIQLLPYKFKWARAITEAIKHAYEKNIFHIQQSDFKSFGEEV